MNLLENLKMLLLNFSFLMIYIIHKMLVLLKNHLNYIKDGIFEYFFKEYNKLLIFLKQISFSQNIMMESLSVEEDNIMKN